MALNCSRKVIWISVAVAAALAVLIVLLVVLLPKGSDSPDYPKVTVEQGELEGEWMESPTGDGFRFASFRGIPFAQPPVGNLRFKAPRPPAKWTGVREARSERDVCVQTKMGSAGVTGSEDCLYLSVFTPQLPQNENELLPVLAYIYGGGWQYGDNRISSNGPDFMVHEGIVMVALKYRLNAFGFLSLDSEEIPGNAAIKDMVAGFNWVLKNIEKFGGDPKKITIMGQSAGAASAHFLAQLPDLNGKIQRAIIMSGSAYHSWAFTNENFDIAQKLGQTLSDTSSTLSAAELTNLFMNSSSEDLGRAAARLVSNMGMKMPELPYAPTREVRAHIENGEPRIITGDSESYFIKRKADPIPTIMGNTNREWTLAMYFRFAKYNETTLRTTLDDLRSMIPKNIVPLKDTQEALNFKTYKDPRDSYPTILKTVHDEYFGSSNASCNLHCKAYLYFDHIMMQLDTARWAKYRAENFPDVPVYLYRFSVTSEYNPIGVPEFTAPFASHSDDLNYYVWRNWETKQDFSGNSLASITLRRMTKMFGNFVKYGNPVPKTDELLPVSWEPNKSKGSKVTLLDIDKDLTLRDEEFIGEHTGFWNDLYAEYRKSD